MAAPKAVRIELSEMEAAELACLLRRRKVAGADALRAGVVLRVKVRSGPTSRLVCAIGVDQVKTDPHSPICTTGNAVVLVPP